MVILRVIQGLAIGGEYGTAVVYAAELAPAGWEGRHGAFIVAFCQGGLLTGEIAVMIGACLEWRWAQECGRTVCLAIDGSPAC